LPFLGAASIPLRYMPFPSTHFQQLVFHRPSLYLVIYFLVYLSALLSPNSYIILFCGILVSSIFSTCPNQRKLFNPVIVDFLSIALISLLVNIQVFKGIKCFGIHTT
jgi:hypothetical protein